MSKVGEMIKEKRLKAKLSQKKLGKSCGISDSEIMKIENGQRKKPSWENLCKIAQALDFNPLEMLVRAGYISNEEIHPPMPFRSIDKLTQSDIDNVQLFIDFIIARKDSITKQK